MQVILAVDAIFPPLTGIGRYALELATRLPRQPGIESVRYLGMWSWVQVPSARFRRSGFPIEGARRRRRRSRRPLRLTTTP